MSAITTDPIATTPLTTTTAPPTDTTSRYEPSPNGYLTNSPSGLSAATYYASIGVALAIIFGLVITSRIMYIRRMRRVRHHEQLELTRRGEETGLPTYRETTNPTSLSYLSNPLSAHRASNSAYPTSSAFSPPPGAPPTAEPTPSQASSSLLSRIPAAFIPSRFRRSNVAGNGYTDPTPPDHPPGYSDPPKYEDATNPSSTAAAASSRPHPPGTVVIPIGTGGDTRTVEERMRDLEQERELEEVFLDREDTRPNGSRR